MLESLEGFFFNNPWCHINLKPKKKAFLNLLRLCVEIHILLLLRISDGFRCYGVRFGLLYLTADIMLKKAFKEENHLN